MKVLNAQENGTAHGPSFSIGNRIYRVFWGLAWTLLAAWTPPPLHAWRRLVLRVFGSNLAPGTRIYGSARIWYPPNLSMGRDAVMGPRVNCYNQGRIDIGEGAVVSQGAHLCASSHDVSDSCFQLVTRPILIAPRAWVAAEAFVGPGVTIGEGAVIGARAAIFRDAEPMGIYRGNPAEFLKRRVMREDVAAEPAPAGEG